MALPSGLSVAPEEGAWQTVSGEESELLNRPTGAAALTARGALFSRVP